MPNFAQIEAGGVTPVKGGGKTIVDPGRRRVLRRPRHDLRRHQHRQARPAEHRPRQPGRRQGRRRRLQHQVVRPAGARARGHARRQAGLGHERQERRGRRVVDDRAPQRLGARPRGGRSPCTKWVQVSRLGNPLINEVIIPIGKKDKFNRTSPANDAQNFGSFALNPEPARLLNALFGLGVQETNRTDIVQALLTGVPGLTADRQEPGRGRHAQAQPGRAAGGEPEPLRRPRGRRGRVPERPPAGGRRGRHRAPRDRGRAAVAAKNVPLGDGVDQNDKPFRAQFPYVATRRATGSTAPQADRAAARPRAAAPDPVIPLGGARRSRRAPRRAISHDASPHLPPPASPRARDRCSRSRARSPSSRFAAATSARRAGGADRLRRRRPPRREHRRRDRAPPGRRAPRRAARGAARRRVPRRRRARPATPASTCAPTAC